MSEPKKYLTLVPGFPGFYHTLLDSLMDDEIESTAQHNMDMKDDEATDDPDIADTLEAEKERLFDKANFHAAMHAISVEWLKAFNKRTGLSLEWESMASPKEYNFTTDRVFAFISQKDLDTVWAAVRHTDHFKGVLSSWFTSYDGFMSFYSNDEEADEWQKPVEEWDHNQLGALIAAYLEFKGLNKRAEFDLSLYYDISETDAVSSLWETYAYSCKSEGDWLYAFRKEYYKDSDKDTPKTAKPSGGPPSYPCWVKCEPGDGGIVTTLEFYHSPNGIDNWTKFNWSPAS